MATLTVEQVPELTDLFMAWERNIYRENTILRSDAYRQISRAIDPHEEPENRHVLEFYQILVEGPEDIIARLTGEVIRTGIEVPELPPELVEAAIDPNEGLLGGFWQRISEFFKLQFANVWAGFANILPGLGRAVRGAFGLLPPEEYTSSFDNMITNMVNAGVMDAEGAAWIKDILDDSKAKGGLLTIAFTVGLAMKSIGMIGDIAGGDFYKLAASKFSPAVPSIEQLLKPLLLAEERGEHITELMRQNGFSEEDVELLKLNAYQMFNTMEIRELFLRKSIGPKQAMIYLHKIGYTDERAEYLMGTWNLIPPVQDIQFMVAKEAFEDDIARATGLDDEFPTDQVEWGEKNGMSRFWQEKYWRAHWSAPSLQMGFEMLHRDVIDEKTLDFLFRIQEIPSFWRDRLLQISYNPYTRVDVRRMRKMGVIGDEEVYRAYRDIGYDHDKATNMLKFTLAYNAQSEKSLSTKEVTRGYSEGVINRTEATSLLRDLGNTEQKTDFLLDMVELEAVQDLAESETRLLERQFAVRSITESAARAALTGLDYSPSKVNALLRQWDIDRELGERLPSKTDLDKMLKADIIDETKYRYFMRRLGYAPDVVDLFYALSRV